MLFDSMIMQSVMMVLGEVRNLIITNLPTVITLHTIYLLHRIESIQWWWWWWWSCFVLSISYIHINYHLSTTIGYYYAPAVSSTQQSIYVIYLPGGGQCFDEASCASRNASRKSSVDAPSSRYLGGVLDSDEEMTHLWGAHKASLLYCSSDGYMGNMGASSVSI